MNPQHIALTDALTRAANYIDALGGDSKPYRSALAAPHAGAAPAGWKLVPVEPTAEMLGAGLRHVQGMASMPSAWEAMLAASPAAPAPSPVVEPETQPTRDNASCGAQALRNDAPAPCALTKTQIERLYANTDRKLLAGMPRAHFERFARFFEDVYQVAAAPVPCEPLTALTKEEAVDCSRAAHYACDADPLARWSVEFAAAITRAFCQKNNLPLRDGGE